METAQILENLILRYPQLANCRNSIQRAYEILRNCFKQGKRLYLCGNGGSASDAEHIVGELMKGFILPRPVHIILPEEKLQYGLPAISLVSQSSLISAIANDNGADLVFAQQVMGYGTKGDVLWGITTSGNSPNILKAVEVAHALKMIAIGLTGKTGGKLKDMCDVCVTVPETDTYKVQELHLPVYHCICMMLEEQFFG
ncbi:MAG: SIS domain-containing protein, partial [Sphaerochaetaceae bacterium]|jgi:D-sedoheptulose 7-phosphate isomerase